MTQVVDLKPQAGSGDWFVVVDAGMTDLMRPALYGAWHGIEPVIRAPGRRSARISSARSARRATRSGSDRELPPLQVGDLLAIRDTGAYGAVMASNYNRRPTAAEVHGRRRHVASRPAPADDRRHAAVGRVMLIAFEGLDQSGKETQARTLRCAPRAGRLQGAPAVVSRLRDADRPGDSAGARRRARVRPDVMQLLYVANRFECRPRLEYWLGAGDIVICDRYRASSVAYGEAQGLDAAWLERNPARPAGAGDHGAARHRAGDRGAPQVGRPRQIRTRPGAARPRSRRATSARRQRTAGCSSTPKQRRMRWRGGRGGRAATARATVSARTSAAPASRNTRAHASSVAPVVITRRSGPRCDREERDASARRAPAEARARRRRAGSRRAARRQPRLRWAMPSPPERAPHR